MQITLNQPDGLHILTKATLSQLVEDDALQAFASGLIPQTLSISKLEITLAEALHQSGSPHINAFLTGLLVLDAEVKAIVDDKPRIFPLPGFFSYRVRFPLDKYPLNTVRLPPLNPNGHYIFSTIEKHRYLAVRLDIHSELKVLGHVRIAISNPTHPPQRIQAIEHRLERQELTKELLNAIMTIEDKDSSLTEVEQTKLVEILSGLI